MLRLIDIIWIKIKMLLKSWPWTSKVVGGNYPLIVLQEIKSHHNDNIVIDSYHLNRSGKSGHLENVENKNHLIGSGGRLADFFNNVEKISIEIDAVKNDVEKINSIQFEMLSKAEFEKLQDQMEELQSDIKQRIIRKIRSKVRCFYLSILA